MSLLSILENADRPIVAADLAYLLGLQGSREGQRRRVRALIKELRDEGCWIIATLSDGYWLTDDFALWRDYLENRKIDAKRIFAEISRRREQVSARKQGQLFGD